MEKKKHILKNGEKAGIIRRIKDFFIRREDIVAAYLFGSFKSKGEFSDIDLGLLSNRNIEDVLEFELALEMQLEKVVGFPIDVRVLNGAPHSFSQNVFRSGELIVDKAPNLRADFEGLVLKKYFDFAHFRRRYLKEVTDAAI